MTRVSRTHDEYIQTFHVMGHLSAPSLWAETGMGLLHVNQEGKITKAQTSPAV